MDIVLRNVAEVVTEEELRERWGGVGYIGYEPSGPIHIGWLVWIFKVKDLVEAGFRMKVLEATWHAWINDKGSWDEVRENRRHVRDVFGRLGVDVEFVDSESLVSDREYWRMVVMVAKHSTLARVRRAITVMGRHVEEADLDFSKLVYPVMQVADALYMGVDLMVGGMDQRKAHMYARDVAERIGVRKPVALHTPVISGLSGVGRMEGVSRNLDDAMAFVKMSKTKPNDAIYLHDEPAEVERKVKMAYCPPRETLMNPVVDIAKYLLLPYWGPLDVDGVHASTPQELEEGYRAGRIEPAGLKRAVSEALIGLLSRLR